MNEKAQHAQDSLPDPEPLATEEVSVPEPLALPTLGEMMIAAREHLSLSAGDMARQLRLGLGQVEALEANRFDVLPGNTFVRGFIRNYAKAVQGEPADFIAAYERSRPQITPSEIVSQNEHIDFMAKPIPQWVWYAGGVAITAVLLPVLIYFVLQDDTPPSQPAAQGVVAPKIVATQTGSNELSLPLPPPQLLSSGDSVLLAPISEAQTSAAEATTASSPKAADSALPGVLMPPAALPSASKTGAATGPVLKIKFVGNAWVEVLDKSGKKIYSQLGRAGSEYEVQGQPPFSLVVGDASRVVIIYNGKLVDLTPHVKKTVARLTLE